MSVPLFVSDRSKPKITTHQLSVGRLIYEPRHRGQWSVRCPFKERDGIVYVAPHSARRIS